MFFISLTWLWEHLKLDHTLVDYHSPRNFPKDLQQATPIGDIIWPLSPVPSQGRPAEFLKRSYLPGHSGKIIELSLLPASKSSVKVNPIQWGKEPWFSTESTLSSEPRTVYMWEALSEDFLHEWMDQWMNGWLISGLCGNTEETRQVKLKRGFPVCSPGAARLTRQRKRETQLGGLGVELGKLSLHLPPVAGDLEIIRVVRNFFVD